jgi:hypothetical protein
MIRPQTWQEVLSNEQIVTCSSCGRILYYDPSHEPPAKAPKKKKKTRLPEPEAESENTAEATEETTPAS